MNFLDSMSKEFANQMEKFSDSSVLSSGSSVSMVNENGNRKITYKFYGEIEHDKKKEYMKSYLNFWNLASKLNLLANIDPNLTIEFNFVKDEEQFFFTFDNDTKHFITTDPNGEKFYYDADNKELVALEKQENTPIVDGNKEEKNDDEVCDGYVKELEGDLKDDENLASNLKSQLTDWKKKEDEEENPCDDCESLFCPYVAADDFKAEIIDVEHFTADFDENGVATRIVFDIDDFDVEYDSDDLNKIYSEESHHLDEFCNEIKNRYNFAGAGWSVQKDANGNVTQIKFILSF